MLTYHSPNYLYLLGGFDGYDCLRDVERVDLRTMKSERRRGLSHPVKNGVGYAEGEGEIYVVGGWDERETQDKVFKYDTQKEET
jgi:hypothetical protein